MLGLFLCNLLVYREAASLSPRDVAMHSGKSDAMRRYETKRKLTTHRKKSVSAYMGVNPKIGVV